MRQFKSKVRKEGRGTAARFLVEVPVMLNLVRIAKKTRGAFPAGATV